MNLGVITQHMANSHRIKNNGLTTKVQLTDDIVIPAAEESEEVITPHGVTRIANVEMPYIVRRGQTLVPVSTVEEESEEVIIPHGVTRIANVEIPYIVRRGQTLVPVSTVEDCILSRYPNHMPKELAQRPPSICHPAVSNEILLLNRMNDENCGLFGGPFVDCELLAALRDVVEFHSLVELFLPNLDDAIIPHIDAIAGGWLQIEDTVVPFLKRINSSKERIRVVPLQVIKHGSDLNIESFGEILDASSLECQLLTSMCQSVRLAFSFPGDTQLIKLKDLLNNDQCALDVTMLHGQNPFQQAQINSRSGTDNKLTWAQGTDSNTTSAENCKKLQPTINSKHSCKTARMRVQNKSEPVPDPKHGLCTMAQDSYTALDLSLKEPQSIPPLIPIIHRQNSSDRQLSSSPAIIQLRSVADCPIGPKTNTDKRKVSPVSKVNGCHPPKRPRIAHLPTLDEVVADINGPSKPVCGQRRQDTLSLTRIKLPPIYTKMSFLKCQERLKLDRASSSNGKELSSDSGNSSKDMSLQEEKQDVKIKEIE